MLVFARREGDEVTIGTAIRIRVSAITSHGVRLVVSAPDGMAIRVQEAENGFGLPAPSVAVSGKEFSDGAA